MNLCNFSLHALLCKKRGGKYIQVLCSFKYIYLTARNSNFAKITRNNILFLSLGNERKMQADPVADIPRKQTNEKCFICCSPTRKKTNERLTHSLFSEQSSHQATQANTEGLQ